MKMREYMSTQETMRGLLEKKDKRKGSGAPVECLGMTFQSDEKRREYFLDKLREKLKDPEFRKIEGFPIGEDEDILALSDPPYYTACPNPFLDDFIKFYGKPYDPEHDDYKREPFAADVSEGKSDPIYNAHSYHTKVPHKAIMRYILHYTEPGDIVFDGFCGTGMTGVAAQLCGDIKAVESLGYKVENDGTILQQEFDDEGKKTWRPFSKLGCRRAALNDLSPAATFIAYNYNAPMDVVEFDREAKRILDEVETECGWMYETIDPKNGAKGKINYTVWSDVFVCPHCITEVVFWDAAVDQKVGQVRDEFPCPKCGAMLKKLRMERAWVTKFDQALNQAVKIAKQVPVLINYTVKNKRYEKIPDDFDYDLIDKVENSNIPYWYPHNRLPMGRETRRNDPIGMTHVHHFFTKRNLWALAKAESIFNKNSRYQFLFTGIMNRALKLNQLHLKYYLFGGGGCNAGHRKGTLYAPSISMETPITELLEDRIKSQIRGFRTYSSGSERKAIVSTSSASCAPEQARANVFDYVFIDPPFGANLNYSELNSLWESWLLVFTNNFTEAIENPVQGKGPSQYRKLMEQAFKEVFRMLKPGRWLTIEFSNTRAGFKNTNCLIFLSYTITTCTFYPFRV